MLKLALVFAIFISGVECGYYFVILPNVIRYNHSETVTVSVFELENAHVQIWLKHGTKLFPRQTVVVPNEKNPVSATVKVTESDLFDAVVKDKPRNIDVCSEYGGKSQCRQVLLSYQTGYLIVQTDKPIYTPLNKVTVRTLALDESLRAVDGWQVGMDIISPKGITMARKTIDKSPSGFYQNEFTLPPYPDIGIWTARSFYRGQFETESRALFEVQEYVLPTFDVTIDVDIPYILTDTNEIKITVRAMYVYKKPVDGNARLTLFLKDESGDTEYLLERAETLDYDGKSIKGSEKEFIIKVKDIMDSAYLSNKGFPDGSRLYIVVKVFDDATGKVEAASHDGTMFAVEPYIFRFTRSKLIFKPGFEYYLKVEMFYMNGQPATRENIEVRMYKSDVLSTTKRATTDDSGMASLFFTTSRKDYTLTFQARTRDGRHESEKFVIEGFISDNQIIAEHVMKDGRMTLRAYTNSKGSESTGILFMVVTRGKVVLTMFEDSTNQASRILSEDIQELISPSARLLVFYVDKQTNTLVADSDKFYVAQKCRGQGLELKVDHEQVRPGDTDYLTITGVPNMWIGLSVIDKALLLLSNKNILRKTKMFKALESHDLGCGVGSGLSAADVFKKTGLTVLTNAVLSENDLQRTSVDCEGSKRGKRDSEECFYDANIRCCEKGYEVAETILYEAVYPERLDPYTRCYAKARELVKKFPMRCIMAFLTSCRTELQALISEQTGIVSKSFDDENYYELDSDRLTEFGYTLRPRNNFRESWLFDVNRLDSSGHLQKSLNYPHSITEWMIQAIGITSDMGICIADPVNVTAFRDFFIQVDLPYKVTRLEQFDVKATIFRYGNPEEKSQTTNIYLKGLEGLCYNSLPGTPSPRIQINLPPNSAETVRFQVIPLKKGKFSVEVSAMVVHNDMMMADSVEKELYVVNEGIEEKVSIQVCLDPNNRMEDCKNDHIVSSNGPYQSLERGRTYTVDLTLPSDSIPGTGSATAYIESNLMDNVVRILIQGVDSLLRAPTGCGEQTLSKFAPTVYAMMYLKETQEITKEIETRGSGFIRDGIVKETSQFMKSDGSFVFFNPSSSVSGGTWLTAYVTKVFCQASRILDDAGIEREDIASSINWLKGKINGNGQFTDDNPYTGWLAGQVRYADHSLTAFVLITLLECDIRDKVLNQTISKAMHFLENVDKNHLKNTPHLLAISTYALAMANSEKKWDFKNLLHQIEQRNGNDIYWGNPVGNPASAQSVETTAYALLAMMEFNDWKTSTNIVRWLTAQRDSAGAFRSTQDTVVGLQALSRYNVKKYTPDVDLDIKLIGLETEHFKLNRENNGVPQIARKLPVEHEDNKLMVKVTGTGTARMIIDLRYNRPATREENCPFVISAIEVDSVTDYHIDVNLAKESNCDVCGVCEKEAENGDYDALDHSEEDQEMHNNFGRRKREAIVIAKEICIKFSVSSKAGKEFGMSIVNFGLETGVEVVRDDLDKLLAENENIERYEMPSSGKGFVVFYLRKITSEETKFIFRLKDGFKGDIKSRQPSSIQVYDYYNPDQSCLEFYGTGPHQAQRLNYTCDKQQRQCQCSLSVCAQSVEEKLLNKERKRPAWRLYLYTCNPEKADYAMLVHIDSVDYDLDKRQRMASGRVLKSLHPGRQVLEVNDEVDFFWSEICDELNLEEGSEYYIIGKDGHVFETSKGKRYKYPVMGTTLVIKTGQKKPLPAIMRNYEKILEFRKGCNH